MKWLLGKLYTDMLGNLEWNGFFCKGIRILKIETRINGNPEWPINDHQVN